VVVPNYNYARYLKERLDSIVRQTYPIFELIVLDDASTDDSVQVLRELLPGYPVDSRLVVNESNGGSVFAQWRRGAELARGELLWIAEADDLADPRFLETTVAAFDDPAMVLSYCQSRQLGTDGTVVCEHYLDYTADVSEDKWLRPYVADGRDEIRAALAVKNTIPNVSGVVFRREALLLALAECETRLPEFRVAGDWLVYVRLLALGRIAFTPEPLNAHRRHQESVTLASFGASQLREILTMQRLVEREFGVASAIAGAPARYAEVLYQQFGLASPKAPRLVDHPQFALHSGARAKAATTCQLQSGLP
jgi:glycosyltransferase involved in cell wall biosynthesis